MKHNLFNKLQENCLEVMNSFFCEHFQEKNIQKYFVTKSRKGDRKTVYFSKTPISWNGIIIGGNNQFSGFPISFLDFEKKETNETNEIFVKKIFNDLDKLQYIKYLEKNILIQRKYIGESKLETVTCQDFETMFGDIFDKSGLIRNAIIIRQHSKFILVPKDKDKKTLKGFKLPTEIKETPEKYLQQSFQKNFQYWLNAKALCTLNQFSFPYIVFDFDDVSFLYKKESFSFLYFLSKINKKKQCVLLSSPVLNGTYTFKIVAKIQNIKTYFEFQEYMEQLNKIIPVSIEKQATILGAHVITTWLKPTLNTKNIILLKKESLEKLFCENEKIQYDEKKHIECLKNIFWNPFFIQDHIEVGNWIITKGTKQKFAKVFNPLDFENETFKTQFFHTFSFQKIVKETKKQNEQNQIQSCQLQNTQKNENNKRKESIQIPKTNRPKPRSSPVYNPELIFNIQNKIEVENQKEMVETEKKEEIQFIDNNLLMKYGSFIQFEKIKTEEKEFFQFLEKLEDLEKIEQLQKLKEKKKAQQILIKQLNKEDFSNKKISFKKKEEANKITFLDDAKLMIKDLNRNHSFMFEFYGRYEKKDDIDSTLIDTFLFCSPCLFKKDGNKKGVSIFLSEKQCTFYCYHESCQKLEKYKPFETEITSKLLQRIFQDNENQTNELSTSFKNLEEVFQKILKKEI